LGVEENRVVRVDGAANDYRERQGWFGRAAILLLFVLFLPAFLLVVGLLLGVALWAGIINLVSEVRFRFRMSRGNRFLRRREFHDRVGWEGLGTLILEAPTLGWGVSRAWWTPDSILNLAPVDQPTLDEYKNSDGRTPLEWDRWCWSVYVNPEDGKAFLLRTWNGASLERRLKARYPRLEVIWTRSALAQLGSGQAV
jgi:hypothetical protein